MTKNFDQFFSDFIKEMTVSDVIPGSGDYAPGDTRIPTILGPTLSRKGKVKRKKCRNRH